MDHPGERLLRSARDRREVAQRVVAELRIERRVDRHRAGVGHPQRIAVGRRLGDELGADRAAGAGLVVDHDGLPERALQLVDEQSCVRIERATGREADDDLHRPLRKRGLGRTGSGQPCRAHATVSTGAASSCCPRVAAIRHPATLRQWVVVFRSCHEAPRCGWVLELQRGQSMSALMPDAVGAV
jgi:hypothetical protein